MTCAGNTWLLCTRTATKDYFWIGRGGEPTNFYENISDESEHRCGYFHGHDDIVEIGLNRLDAARRDNINRHIRHSLILSAAANGKEAEFLRKLFAQAIIDASPTATDSAAAELGRRLYAWWEESGSANAAAAVPDWWDLAKDLAASLPELPAAPQLQDGWYYRRNAAVLSRFAASVNHSAPILLLCAATNYIGRIWPPENRDVPAIVCALEDAPLYGESLEMHSTRMQSAPRGDFPSASNLGQKIMNMKWKLPPQWSKKLPFLILLVVAIAVAVMYWLRPPPELQPGGQGGTPQAATPEQENKTEATPGPSIPVEPDAPAPESQPGDQDETPPAGKREQTVAPPQPVADPLRPNAHKGGIDP